MCWGWKLGVNFFIYSIKFMASFKVGIWCIKSYVGDFANMRLKTQWLSGLDWYIIGPSYEDVGSIPTEDLSFKFQHKPIF